MLIDQDVSLGDWGREIPVPGWVPAPGPTGLALSSSSSFPAASCHHLATDRAPWLDIAGLDDWSPPQHLTLPQTRTASAVVLGLLSSVSLLPISTFF